MKAKFLLALAVTMLVTVFSTSPLLAQSDNWHNPLLRRGPDTPPTRPQLPTPSQFVPHSGPAVPSSTEHPSSGFRLFMDVFKEETKIANDFMPYFDKWFAELAEISERSHEYNCTSGSPKFRAEILAMDQKYFNLGKYIEAQGIHRKTQDRQPYLMDINEFTTSYLSERLASSPPAVDLFSTFKVKIPVLQVNETRGHIAGSTEVNGMCGFETTVRFPQQDLQKSLNGALIDNQTLGIYVTFGIYNRFPSDNQMRLTKVSDELGELSFFKLLPSALSSWMLSDVRLTQPKPPRTSGWGDLREVMTLGGFKIQEIVSSQKSPNGVRLADVITNPNTDYIGSKPINYRMWKMIIPARYSQAEIVSALEDIRAQFGRFPGAPCDDGQD